MSHSSSPNRWTVADEPFTVAKPLNRCWWAIHRRRWAIHHRRTVADELSLLLMIWRRTVIVADDPSPNRRHYWWTVADKPLTVTDKPTLRLQITCDASPCSHQGRFSFIGDALKCYFSSCCCQFSMIPIRHRFATHSSPILDGFEVLFQPIRRRFEPFATKSSLLIQTIRRCYVFFFFPSAHVCWEWVFISFLVLHHRQA